MNWWWLIPIIVYLLAGFLMFMGMDTPLRQKIRKQEKFTRYFIYLYLILFWGIFILSAYCMVMWKRITR